MICDRDKIPQKCIYVKFHQFASAHHCVAQYTIRGNTIEKNKEKVKGRLWSSLHITVLPIHHKKWVCRSEREE